MEVVQHREIETGRIGEVAPQLDLRRCAKMVDRASQVQLVLLAGELPRELLDAHALSAPDVVACPVLRMQRADRHVEASHREAGRDDAIAESAQLVLDLRALEPALDEPLAHAAKLEWCPGARNRGGRRWRGHRCKEITWRPGDARQSRDTSHRLRPCDSTERGTPRDRLADDA